VQPQGSIFDGFYAIDIDLLMLASARDGVAMTDSSWFAPLAIPISGHSRDRPAFMADKRPEVWLARLDRQRPYLFPFRVSVRMMRWHNGRRSSEFRIDEN
jgi:hypothetical protein